MKLSSRQHDLIRIIFSSEDYITIEAIAQKLTLSTRTIKRELEEISLFFETIGVNMQKKSGKGLKIIKDEATLDLLSSILDKKTIPVFSAGKRVIILLLTLLFADEPQKRFSLASLLGTSELTVSSDLVKCEEVLKAKKITLVKKQGYGIYVVASEERRRVAIFEIIEDATRGFSLLEVPSKTIGQFVQTAQLREIANILEVCNAGSNLYSSDRTRDMLALHLYIQKKRVGVGNKITLSAENTSEKALEISSEILSNMIDKFKISYSIGEIHFFADIITLTQGVMGVSGESETANYIARKLATKLEGGFGILVDAENEFFTSLIRHLVSTVNRNEKNIDVLNPILSEIQSTYPEIYKMVEECGREISEEVGINFTKDEIGYITMHMCVIAIDGKSQRIRKCLALVVCPSGFVSSQLLGVNVKKAFPNLEILQSASVSQVESILSQNENIDLIISTVAVQTSLPLAVVSPFISPKDKDIISVAMQQVSKVEIMREVKEIETEMASSVVSKMETKSIIADILSDVIFEMSQGESVGDVISQIASYYAEDSESEVQISLDIKSREEIGSTVMADGETMLIHAKTAGVSKACFGVVRFEKPILLKNPKESVSSSIVMLSPVKSKLAIKVLSEISQQLIYDDNFYEIVKKGNKSQIKEKIKEILYNYYYNNFQE